MSDVTPHTLTTFLEHFKDRQLATDDIVYLLLPLLEQVQQLHQQNLTAKLSTNNIVIGSDGGLQLKQAEGIPPTLNLADIRKIEPEPSSALNIIGQYEISRSELGSLETKDESIVLDPTQGLTKPAYILGLNSWESVFHHHDQLSDMMILGLIVASVSLGLDFNDAEDLGLFVAHRDNLFVLNDRLHPVIANLIVEMTALARYKRLADIDEAIIRLKTWRDQPINLNLKQALKDSSNEQSKHSKLLGYLRDRLFDLSRRNRLLYFKPTANMVNLTMGSVPLILQLAQVKPDQLCTGNGAFAKKLLTGKPLNLHEWLRLEDHTYMTGALDKLIAETKRDKTEYGFNNLRLVIAFLRWHNLKEDPDERITTPLLWLSVSLIKSKGVKDQYILQSDGAEAEFNPIVRYQLNQLYNIQLPESIDLTKTSLQDVHQNLLTQIHCSEPAVDLRWVEQVEIDLVRQKAIQRLEQTKRHRWLRSSAPQGGLPEYSYDAKDYRPLGKALYDHWVSPTPMPQRFEANRKALPTSSPQWTQQGEEQLGYMLKESKGHRYLWDFDLSQVTLANFNYKKMSLVHDYNTLLEQPEQQSSFERLFPQTPKSIEREKPQTLPIQQKWSIVASDASQDMAVAVARNQQSFIIQGPPGTGKSQTITNLIADYIAMGKRVLFVCEKRAALDVVYARLKQGGLDRLCSLIHDSQADKKAFILDLKTCYESWIDADSDLQALEQQRTHVTSELSQHISQLERYEYIMSQDIPDAGMNVRQLVRRMLSLPSAPPISLAMRENLPKLAIWDGQYAQMLNIKNELSQRSSIRSFAAHPFSKLSAQVLLGDQPYQRTEQMLSVINTLINEHALLSPTSALVSADDSFVSVMVVSALCHQLVQSSLIPHLKLLDQTSLAYQQLQTQLNVMRQHTANLEKQREKTTFWHDKFTPQDTEIALNIAKQLEPTFMRWFQPKWWRLRGQMIRRYNFAQHAMAPSYTEVLSALNAEHEAVAIETATKVALAEQYAVGDLNQFLDAIHQVDTLVKTHHEQLSNIVNRLQNAPEPVTLIEPLAKACPAYQQFAQDLQVLTTVDLSSSLLLIRHYCAALTQALPQLLDVLPLLTAIHSGDAQCSSLFCQLDASLEQMTALVVDESFEKMKRQHASIDKGSAFILEHAQEIYAKQQQLIKLNAKLILAHQHEQFRTNVLGTNTPAQAQDQSNKAFLKRYQKGRKELEHEFNKTMRYRSIRDLTSADSGLVIEDLKPIWLMSPLSVSDTLPLQANLFDVVIFDEASQIPLEESIPALSRAQQTIVVGDEKQLPPTHFFSSSTSSMSEDEAEDDDALMIGINRDVDSLLSQSTLSLPAILLEWHYRSRHELLISYSNAAFYESRLITIPDHRISSKHTALDRLISTDTSASERGLSMLLSQPISYHHIGDGVYVDRSNVPEAYYIAQLVRRLLQKGNHMSIGIVAFSEAQQRQIELALESLAAQDAEFATLLDDEYNREEDDQFDGLFVKNLENVQGDERDIIILSICYAPNAQGKMTMSFGPINQRGGEKRLNVIFSRARHRMAVVTTIHGEAITNTHNTGAMALRQFLQFAKLSAVGDASAAQNLLGNLNPNAKKVFAQSLKSDSVRDQLAQALKQNGYNIAVNVGCSSFRCDLAIQHPTLPQYHLAILIDSPDSVTESVIDRYVFSPHILDNFGWQVLNVAGQDWLKDPASVVQRINTTLPINDL